METPNEIRDTRPKSSPAARLNRKGMTASSDGDYDRWYLCASAGSRRREVCEGLHSFGDPSLPNFCAARKLLSDSIVLQY
jgi:hypothetical protein